MVVGNWYWRMCEEGFLEADERWIVKGEKMAEIRSV